MQSPVEQFTIKTLIPLELFGYDISFTNASLFMILSVIISTSFLYIGIRKSHLVPDRLQNSVEILYLFIADMVKENVGKGGKNYFYIHLYYLFEEIRFFYLNLNIYYHFLNKLLQDL